jgi:hypothetical protein
MTSMEHTNSTAIETHSNAHTSKRRRWLAWFTWVLYLALAFTTLVVEFANNPSLLLPNVYFALLLFAFATVGALIASRRPENPIGWLLCVCTLLMAVGTLAMQYAIYALVTNPGTLPGGDWAGVLGAAIRGVGLMILLTYVLLLFPDGHLPSARWRPVVWLAIAGQALFILAAWLAPGPEVDPPIKFMQSPLRVPMDPSTLESLGRINLLADSIIGVICGISVVSRLRHAQGDERQQLKWFAYAALLAIVMLTIIAIRILQLIVTLKDVFNTGPQFLTSLLLSLAVTGFPVAIGIAVLKYRLYDIDLLINRTLVYVPLTAIVAGVFAASILLAQRLFIALTGQQSDAATAFATLVTVATFDPLKTRLQALVDKRFKEPPDPTKNLKAFNEQVRSVIQVIDSKQLMRRLLEEAVRSFGADSGAVFLQRDGKPELVHTCGNWQNQVAISVPLQADGAQFGVLSLGTRRDGNEYSAQDRETLQQTADIVADAIALAEHSR